MFEIKECLNVIKNMWATPEYQKIIITPEAFLKLQCYINLVGDLEITGFGRLQKNDDGSHTCIDFEIIEQEVRSAYVEADADATLKFLMSLPAEQRGEWMLDWHSHVNMGTSPSSTDWGNYEKQLTARLGKQFPFIIVNKKCEATSGCYLSENKHPNIEIVVQQADIPAEKIDEIYEYCKKEVQEKCTKYTATVTSTWNSFGGVKTTTGTPEQDKYGELYKGYNHSRWWYGRDDYDDEVEAGVKCDTKKSSTLIPSSSVRRTTWDW